MRATATWIVAGAVLVLLVAAVADGIRSRADASGAPAAPPRVLHGVIVTADAACQTHAFRLPSLAPEHAPRPPDCNGLEWSQDGSIVARCRGDFTAVTSSDGIQFPNVDGCAPAWRGDGALSVVRDGNIVIARRRGAPFIVFSRPQLTEALRAAGVEDPGEWTFAQVSWFGLTSFVAILQKPGDSAAAVFAQGGVETFVPHIGAHIEDLRASPIGNFAFARVDPEREYVMLSRGGDPISLPAVRGATAIAWSPDERYVAISTDDETTVARTGTTKAIATLPFGAHALDWLS
jgi:hypothetical protein